MTAITVPDGRKWQEKVNNLHFASPVPSHRLQFAKDLNGKTQRTPIAFCEFGSGEAAGRAAFAFWHEGCVAICE